MPYQSEDTNPNILFLSKIIRHSSVGFPEVEPVISATLLEWLEGSACINSAQISVCEITQRTSENQCHSLLFSASCRVHI